MRVIDSAESAAEAALKLFGNQIAPPSAAPQSQPDLSFFATDSVEKFERLGSRFLERPVTNVGLVDLGG